MMDLIRIHNEFIWYETPLPDDSATGNFSATIHMNL